MEHPWFVRDEMEKGLEKSQQMGVTDCISVEKRTNMNKEWVS